MNSALTSTFRGSRHTISKLVTANYTIDDLTEVTNVDATSGPITITLPLISANVGRLVTVRKIDSTGNAVTVQTSGSDLFQGVSSTILGSQWDVLSIDNDGSDWYVSSGSGAADTGSGTYTFTVPGSIDPNDPVYVTTANNADLADATSIATGPCIGFVSTKLTATSAVVQTNGFLAGFTGLVAGDTYFLAVGGGITTTPPNTVGNIIQKIGIAVSTTVLWIQPTLDFTIR